MIDVIIRTEVFDALKRPSELEKRQIVDFLHEHLQEYGDPKSDILKCINFAVKETMSFTPSPTFSSASTLQ